MQRTIYYTHLASPWGPLFLAGTEKGICSCQFLPGKDISNLISQLWEKPDHLVQENALPLVPAIDVLEQYFSGETKHLSHALDLQGTPFQRMVWSALREIPLGKVTTYGEIAGEIGRPRAARAVAGQPALQADPTRSRPAAAAGPGDRGAPAAVLSGPGL